MVKKYHPVIFLLAPLLLFLLPESCRAADKMTVWRQGVRGVNTRWDRTEADLRYLRGHYGANVIRLLGNRTPLRSPEPPYAFIEENWQMLHRVCDLARQRGLYVVIDPHTTPGTARAVTTQPKDPLWQDKQYHDLLVETWTRLAREFKDRPEVIGYDLMNEPSIYAGAAPGSPGDWNGLVRRLIRAIRAEDPATPLVIEPPVVIGKTGDGYNRVAGLFSLDTDWGDPRIVYSPHFYLPGQFTHQGVNNRPFGVPYPGCETAERQPDKSWRKTVWDKEALRAALEPAVRFGREQGAVLFFGEFSANRTAPGGDTWVRDVISLFEEYHWSWAYHSYREAPVWDSELGPDPANKQRLASTLRMEYLRDAFRHNAGNLLPAAP